jgi:phosphate acetyltransferase
LVVCDGQIVIVESLLDDLRRLPGFTLIFGATELAPGFHEAIDPEAAKIKGIQSPVAGRAQILVVPDLEAGNMLAKNLIFLAKADSAGLVLGARVPIVLTSRADSVRSRKASCAAAALYAAARRGTLNVAAA